MKNIINTCLVLGLVFIVGCQSDANSTSSTQSKEKVEAKKEITTNAQPGETVTYKVTESKINWEGTKKIGSGHKGSIDLQTGTLEVKDNQIAGGDLVFNMASIKCSDLEGESKANLEGHLKSGDFFAVEEFPEATVQITSLENAQSEEHNAFVTADVTIKGITKSIKAPARIFMKDGKLAANTQLEFDRREWGVVYGSESSFADLAADKIINDMVKLQIRIVAEPA